MRAFVPVLVATFALASCGGRSLETAPTPTSGPGGSSAGSPSGGSSAGSPSGAASTGLATAGASDAEAEAVTSTSGSAPAEVGDAGPDATWPPTRQACEFSSTGTFQSPPPPAGPTLTSCAQSDQVVLSDAQIVAQDGGATVTPGSTATVIVLVDNGGSQGLGYPCVGLAAKIGR